MAKVVLVYPATLDVDEARRIRDALLEATGDDARPICPAGSAMLFPAFAEFGNLRKKLEEAKAITTQILLLRVCEPWTTTGFAPTAAKLKRHLDPNHR
ncbi:MAG: hypothetical protein LBF93_03620 [Zoogloeaceae bacterium]|nr:hypothetical protein [Zoogloeaceae bacterium]